MAPLQKRVFCHNCKREWINHRHLDACPACDSSNFEEIEFRGFFDSTTGAVDPFADPEIPRPQPAIHRRSEIIPPPLTLGVK